MAGRRVVVFVAGLVTMVAALTLLTQAPAGATAVVASYGFAPSPIASNGSLGASATVPVTVTAKDSLGTAVPGATIYLALLPTTGGGSATVGAMSLGTKPQAFVANASGQVSIAYHTPAILPNGGKDTLKAQNAAVGATISARDSYCFSKVGRYVFTPTPIASAGSLAGGATVPVTVTAKDSLGTAVPGATIYLALAPTTGGGSAAVVATPLSTTPQPFVANASGQVSITYHTPATLPTTGADIIKAQDAAVSPCATKANSYSYSSPTLTPTPTPTPTATPSNSDPVIVAAGDIACQPRFSATSSTCRQKFVADRLIAINPKAVLALGDSQYECGSLTDFNGAYDVSWGRFKPITKPAIGNHEYLTSPGLVGDASCTTANAGARGYFDYFTRGVTSPLDNNPACSTPGNQNCKGYYSYDIGTWHIIALNSNCRDVGGCGAGSPQYNWLNQDLANHPNKTYPCTLAYWHIPLYSSGSHHALNSQSLYKLLYDNNADLILTGHEHNYERFAPQDYNGVADNPRGIRQFIIGTGGANHHIFGPIAANSEFRDSTHFGVIMITLHANSYDWQFVAEDGAVIDSGSTGCHS